MAYLCGFLKWGGTKTLVNGTKTLVNGTKNLVNGTKNLVNKIPVFSKIGISDPKKNGIL